MLKSCLAAQHKSPNSLPETQFKSLTHPSKNVTKTRLKHQNDFFEHWGLRWVSKNKQIKMIETGNHKKNFDIIFLETKYCYCSNMLMPHILLWRDVSPENTNNQNMHRNRVRGKWPTILDTTEWKGYQTKNGAATSKKKLRMNNWNWKNSKISTSSYSIPTSAYFYQLFMRGPDSQLMIAIGNRNALQINVSPFFIH